MQLFLHCSIKEKEIDLAFTDTHNSPILASLQDVLNTLWLSLENLFFLSTKRVQIKQLTQAMQRMNDVQLTKIGITRSEIEDYACMTIRVFR